MFEPITGRTFHTPLALAQLLRGVSWWTPQSQVWRAALVVVQWVALDQQFLTSQRGEASLPRKLNCLWVGGPFCLFHCSFSCFEIDAEGDLWWKLRVSSDLVPAGCTQWKQMLLLWLRWEMHTQPHGRRVTLQLRQSLWMGAFPSGVFSASYQFYLFSYLLNLWKSPTLIIVDHGLHWCCFFSPDPGDVPGTVSPLQIWLLCFLVHFLEIALMFSSPCCATPAHKTGSASVTCWASAPRGGRKP